ncbi:MAG: hypothetical protein HYV27_15085 [Candidatus Hydrogenedentes bacterium]|nr:hypothetical protein [Candidatus Hydrogenedentota bacterium]
MADHLALAAEDERAHGASETAAWQQALERFGDPDALARRLWWDAMKEQIMREWIQTAFLAVMAVAMCAFGFVAIQQIQANNRAMLDAMASSNEAMLRSLAELSATNTQMAEALRNNAAPAAGALPLPAKESLVDIVVRRGTAEGPPAVGVEVSFTSTGDESLTVRDVTNHEGRVSFGPVADGAYWLALRDPQSQMWLEGFEVVRFAGRGQEEVQVVAPDQEARPLQCTMDLPAVGRDEDQFFCASYGTFWGEAPQRWHAGGMIMIGKDNSWGVRRADPRAITRLPIPLAEIQTGKIPLVVSGSEIELSDFYFYDVQESGDAATAHCRDLARMTVELDGSWAIRLGAPGEETLKQYTYAAMQKLTSALGVQSVGAILPSLIERFDGFAPTFHSEFPSVKTGYWKEAGGAVQFAPFTSSRLVVFEPVGGGAGMVVMDFPEMEGQKFSEAARYLVAFNCKSGEGSADRILLDGNKNDFSFTWNVENVLAAYALRTPWTADGQEKILRFDATPLWSAGREELRKQVNVWTFIDVSEAVRAGGAQPLHGIGLRWQENTPRSEVRGIQLYSRLDQEKSPGTYPQFVVLEPLEAVLARVQSERDAPPAATPEGTPEVAPAAKETTAPPAEAAIADEAKAEAPAVANERVLGSRASILPAIFPQT